MTDFHHLLSPLTLGKQTVRNRVLVSAHVPGFAENNKPGEKYIAYHRNYAKAGVGLQITGGTPVHKSGLLSVSSDALWNLNDEIIPGYKALSSAIQKEGGCILAQLAHSAGTVLINQPGRESWAPSPVRSLTTGNIAHEMTTSEIQEVVAAFGEGAKRAAEGNMNGVEILGAFGFLPQAFLSPLTNWREDEYGGSLDNRLRFLLEVLAIVRKEIGNERILGVRLPGDEFEPDGLTLTDMKIVAKKLNDSGLIDYLNIIAHTNFTYTGRAKHWAPTPSPHGTFVELAAAIRKVVGIPVFTVGRITDPHLAEQIIADGKADMVGMTRAHICDPLIVEKIKRKALSEIRPCVGANTCIANRYAGKPIRCMHNPAIVVSDVSELREQETKHVVIIGAGPAGLEAGRITAERGHTVTIYEANDHPGGQLALWAKAPSMGELQKIIDWRCSELERHGASLILNHAITLEELNSLRPDVVIVATGSYDNVESINGSANIAQLTPHEVLRGNIQHVMSAVVWNDGRGQAGLAAAEKLLQDGANVEIITSDIAVAADLDPTNRIAWMQRLGKLGCQMLASSVVQCVSGNVVTLRDIYSECVTERYGVDLIVDWRGCKVNDELVNIKATDFLLFAVGDCVAPRTVEVAMSEAAKAANTIFDNASVVAARENVAASKR